MNTTSTNTAIQDAETLLRLVTETYQAYFDGLEAFAKTVPDSDTETLSRLSSQIKKAQESMEHDFSLFDKAIFKDKESLQHLREQLKIDELRNSLSK